MGTAGILFWSGVIAEAIGLLLVAASDYFPLATDMARAARQRTTPIVNRVRRLLRRPGSTTVTAGAADALALASRASVMLSTSETAPLEDKVAFLLRESTRTQERLNALEATTADLPERWRRDVAELREELLERIERRLTETEERYVRARRVGLVLLLLGVVLVSASNLL